MALLNGQYTSVEKSKQIITRGTFKDIPPYHTLTDLLLGKKDHIPPKEPAKQKTGHNIKREQEARKQVMRLLNVMFGCMSIAQCTEAFNAKYKGENASKSTTRKRIKILEDEGLVMQCKEKVDSIIVYRKI